MKNQIFKNKEDYLNAIKAWKNTCKDKSFQFQPEHFALYAIIRGKDPKKCFASPEQQSCHKLITQGKSGNETYERCMNMIFNEKGWFDAAILAPFEGTITKLDLIQIRIEYKEAA